ncbi:MAG TPA: PAS domain S-box protein [Rhodocyclaceae bacterium]
MNSPTDTPTASSAQHTLHQALLDAQSRAGIGLFIIREKRIAFANEAICRMLGYSEAEMLALPSFLALVHPDHRELLAANHARRVAGEVFDNSYEVAALTKEGERRDVQVTIVAMPSAAGVELLVITVDITERKLAQQARRRSEAMLRDIVEGTSRATGAAFFRALVRQLASALGVPIALVGEVRPSEPNTLHSLALWTGEGFGPDTDYDLLSTPCGRVFSSKKNLFACDLEACFPEARSALQAMGAQSYFGYPLTDADGAALGVLAIMDRQPMEPSEERASLMAIFAARAAAELERLRAEAGVRRSEQKFSQIFRASPVAMSMSRLGDGQFLEVNDAYLRTFRWPREAMLGRTAVELGLWVDLAQRQIWVDALRRDGRVANFEARMRDAAAEEHSVLISAELLTLDGEECVLVFIHDVTEQQLAQAEIRQLNAELEARVERRTAELLEANRELESFAYSISHDLRAPLRGIDGFSRLLQEEYGAGLDQQGNEYLTRVRRAAQRLGTLIDDLLELSRVSRHEMRRVNVDLSAVAGDVVEDLRHGEPDRSVAVNIAPRCSAYGDPQLLRVLLENLLGNAWKYSRNKEGARIEFGHDEAGYFVRDNGAGFDMAYAQKLFMPFQRLHNPAEFEGSGIGLASAARVVRRHGGRIWAESSPGAGAVFRFTL